MWLVAVPLLAATAAHAQPKNVLFYGNSFTLGFGSTRSVNALFNDIAIAAGQDPPLVQSAAASGQSLNWHLNNNTAAIFTLIPPGQNWDFVVMQEHSTKLTRVFDGSPGFPASLEASQADAIGLYQRATTRSPDVVPVLYETWARGPGHAFYAGASPDFRDPAEMQAEIREGYDQLAAAINGAAGSNKALIAPVGDAWENANFDQLHATDLWHAQNRGTLLAALVIYGTVYGDATTSDIDLAGVLASLNLTPNDGAFLTAAADRTLRPIPEPSSVVVAGMCLAAASCSAPRRCRAIAARRPAVRAAINHRCLRGHGRGH
jgi:hypothetical protein